MTFNIRPRCILTPQQPTIPDRRRCIGPSPHSAVPTDLWWGGLVGLVLDLDLPHASGRRVQLQLHIEHVALDETALTGAAQTELDPGARVWVQESANASTLRDH